MSIDARTSRFERASYIRARVAFDDAARALAIAGDITVGDGGRADCYKCGAHGGLAGFRGGYHCGVCGETGDVIELVKAARGCGGDLAMMFLEEKCLDAGRFDAGARRAAP